MTIEQAWAIVLEHYHDALPPEWQWRQNVSCSGRQSLYPERRAWVCECGWSMKVESYVPPQERLHDIPAPALTDAAAMAVLRAAVISFREELCADIIVFTDWYQVTFRDVRAPYIQKMEPRRMPSMRDPEFKVAAILAAAELAQRERAK